MSQATMGQEASALLNRLYQTRQPQALSLERLKELADLIYCLDGPSGLALLGAWHAFQGQAAQAVDFHNKSIAMAQVLAQGRSELHNLLARSLDFLGDYAGAARATADALALEPRNYNYLLSIIYETGKAGLSDEQALWIKKYEALRLEEAGQCSLSSCECFNTCCANGGLKEWEDAEEDEAWDHLQ